MVGPMAKCTDLSRFDKKMVVSRVVCFRQSLQLTRSLADHTFPRTWDASLKAHCYAIMMGEARSAV